jgi:hypothetical protein
MQTMDQIIESNVKKSIKTLTNLLMDSNVTKTTPILSVADFDYSNVDKKLSMLMITLKFEVDIDDNFSNVMVDTIKTFFVKLESILNRFGFTESGTIAKQPKEIVYSGLLVDKIVFNSRHDFILIELDALFS